ncbi:unnamed protein product [Camellia sinensis]
MGKEKPKSIGVWPAVRPFVNGGASGMLATCVIQLIDMIKDKFCNFHKYAHYLFENGSYEEAMEQFLASQVEITYVLSLYPSIVLPKSAVVPEPKKYIDITGDTPYMMESPPTSQLLESDESAALESKKMSHNMLMVLIKFLQKKRYSIIEKAIAEGTGEVVSDAVGDNYVLYDSNQFKKSSKRDGSNAAGPTSFGPIIEMAMTIVEKSGGQYHVTRSVDSEHGQLSPQGKKTVEAIVAASKLPLSIILVGVGDGPWDMMREFDDNIPARAFDNFQFVNFTEIMSKNVAQSRKETEFALAALMEIPSQYKATIELNILGGQKGNVPERVPLPPPVYSAPSFSSSKSSCSSNFQQSLAPYHGHNSPISTAPPASRSTFDNQRFCKYWDKVDEQWKRKPNSIMLVDKNAPNEEVWLWKNLISEVMSRKQIFPASLALGILNFFGGWMDVGNPYCEGLVLGSISSRLIEEMCRRMRASAVPIMSDSEVLVEFTPEELDSRNGSLNLQVTKMESDDHVLLHCPFVWLLWSHVIRWWGLVWALPGSVNDLLQWWAGVNLSKLETKIWNSILFAAEESKFVFEAKIIQRMELLVLSTLQWKMNSLTHFHLLITFRSNGLSKNHRFLKMSSSNGLSEPELRLVDTVQSGFKDIRDSVDTPMESHDFFTVNPQTETQTNNPFPDPSALDEECELMDSTNSNDGEQPVLQKLDVHSTEAAKTGETHEVLKPIAVHSKSAINVDELVGISKLSIGESFGDAGPSPLLLKLLEGSSSRQSSFQANPGSGSSRVNSSSNPIHAV